MLNRLLKLFMRRPAVPKTQRRGRGRLRSESEDAKVLSVEATPPSKCRAVTAETPIKALARELGRSENSVLCRRWRLLAKRGSQKKAVDVRAARDREIVAKVRAGWATKEAARFHGVSPQVAGRVLDKLAPELKENALERGYTRRTLRLRIASELWPRLIEAAEIGEGITLDATEVAHLTLPLD